MTASAAELRAHAGAASPSVMAHVVVDDAVLRDLELALDGVSVPWTVLGGSALSDDAGSLRVRVALPSAVAVVDGGSLVLTDPTSLPVARLDDVQTVGPQPVDAAGSTGSLVEGTLVALPVTGRATPDWAAGSARVVVVQRPLLADELAGLVSAGDPVLLLVPTGPSPDGIPARVLLDVTRSCAADEPTVTTQPVPLHWRGAVVDGALVEALGARLERPVALLGADDPTWLAARDDVRDGRVPAGVDARGADALTAWRPPVGRRGVVVFFTGFSGSGKSTVAEALVEHVRDETRRTITLLDGDVVRTMLSSGLGFDRAGRDLNIRRIGYVAAEIARHHGMAVCAPIAPFAETRAAVRAMVEEVGDFVLVHVATPIEECERRDRKGLYARARSGEIPDFTGISSPYEVPDDADLVIDTTGRTLEDSLDQVLTHLRSTGWITA